MPSRFCDQWLDTHQTLEKLIPKGRKLKTGASEVNMPVLLLTRPFPSGSIGEKPYLDAFPLLVPEEKSKTDQKLQSALKIQDGGTMRPIHTILSSSMDPIIILKYLDVFKIFIL